MHKVKSQQPIRIETFEVRMSKDVLVNGEGRPASPAAPSR
jgi:hypothetical protein